MKIAIQFYGHLRTYQKCFPSIQKWLLNKYDCDVFMHTWSETEHRTKTWHNYKMKHIESVDKELIGELKKIYNLKDILVEEQKQSSKEEFITCLHNNNASTISINGINFMLHSQYKVNDLREQYQSKNKINYDYVLMLRPDIFLYNELDFNLLDREIRLAKNKQTRFCGINPMQMKEFALALDSATDTLYFAIPEIMSKTVKILNNINLQNYKGEIWNPENLFNRILLENNVISTPILYIRARDWNIVRENAVVPDLKMEKAKNKKIIQIKIGLNKSYIKLFPYKKSIFNFSLVWKNQNIFQLSWGKY